MYRQEHTGIRESKNKVFLEKSSSISTTLQNQIIGTGLQLIVRQDAGFLDYV